MKTFYVLWDGTHYVYDDRILMDRHGVASYTEYLGEAMRFESLCQALDFNESSGLKLEVLRVDITSVYTPDLAIPTFPGTEESVPQPDDSRWEDATLGLVDSMCYGLNYGGSIGKGVLKYSRAGYFYIEQKEGFEFGVSKVIISEKP